MLPVLTRASSRPALCLGALLISATTAPRAALAYERATVDDRPGIYLYWAKRTISYSVHEDGCADVSLLEALGAVKRAFFTWASSSCTDIYFGFDGLSEESTTNLVKLEAGADQRNLIVWRERAWPPEGADQGAVTSDVAALTTLSFNTETGEIIDADIDLNGFDNFWTATDDPTKAATDIQNVLTHEIGHLLGLAHTDDAEATMYGETPQGELDKRSLGDDDLAALCAVYPYGEPTPVGEEQPPPHTGVQGAASGCAASGSPPTLAPLCLVLLALLSGARRTPRR